MKAGDNGRELDMRVSPQIEGVVPVAQGKTAWFLAQSEERAREVCAPANGDENVLTVSIKLKVDIWRHDRVLSQRQPRVVMQCHAEKHLRRWRWLDRARSLCVCH